MPWIKDLRVEPEALSLLKGGWVTGEDTRHKMNRYAWVIGLALGGTTGYAINPARDLGPRIAHAVLPIPGKGPSGWGYAWIPVVAPCVGAAVAGALALALGI